MSNMVKLTINDTAVEAPAGTLLIDAAKLAGIEIPAFCYYEGMSLQAACRMCLVEIEKAPKLMAACVVPVGEGMVVRTESPAVVKARKTTLEFLLTNHPLDCPVCDKGGECELQDMVFKYGAGESRFTEVKQHVPEKQWSPVVFYDGPRCILCYRCVRVCNEGMGVGALGIVNRGVAIYENLIITAVLDGRLIALDIATGKPVWEARVSYPQDNYSLTIAPRIAKGKVVVGVAGAEYPVRGFIVAFDALTGRQAWKFYTVPGDPSKPFEHPEMKTAAATWSGDFWKLGGGGSVWDGMAYDPDLNLLYVGTGNGGPWPEDLRKSKGKDNLYLCSILAINPDNGQQIGRAHV